MGRVIGVFLLGLFLLARFGDMFRMPFLNDDYVFLDHVTGKSFGSLWGFKELAFHWWRPWSREFHYWWIQGAFGPVEWPFHLASLALACGVLAAFWSLGRRLVGAPAAAVAVAGAATLSGWGLLLLWPAGAQDLWMLLLSLLALSAWHDERPFRATLFYALAIMSKETAALLVVLFALHDRWVGRRPWQETVLRLAPALLLSLVWVFVHPMLLGRLWAGAPTPTPPSPAAVAPWVTVWRSLLSVFALDLWPHPEGGWRAVWWDGLRGALILIAFIELLARPDERPANVLAGGRIRSSRGTMPLAWSWWACGTLPLLLPGLGWHAYYAHFAVLGLWLVVGRTLARHPGVAMVLIGTLGFLGAGRAATPSEDWGEAAYQRRAGAFVSGIKEQLLGAYPTMEKHARLWFVRLPNNVGFLAGDGPVVRVWYRDPTLQAGFYSAYRARTSDEPQGPDRFFRMDELGRFQEVKRDGLTATSTTADGNADATRGRDPRWERDHVSLAHTLAAGRDWRGAAAEFRRLAIAFPDSSGYAFDAATAFLQAGDSTAGAAWLREAARRPGAPPEVVRAVREADRPAKPARGTSGKPGTGTSGKAGAGKSTRKPAEKATGSSKSGAPAKGSGSVRKPEASRSTGASGRSGGTDGERRRKPTARDRG